MPQPAEIHVYWGRTRGMWSLRSRGIVVGHVSTYALYRCSLVVSEAARLRLQRPGARREVHAWIRGRPLDALAPYGLVQIGYRPSEPGFRRRDTGAVIGRALMVWFREDGTCWASL